MVALAALALGAAPTRCAVVLDDAPGAEVRVALAAPAWPNADAPDDLGLVTLPSGAEVLVERALLSVASVELEPCATALRERATPRERAAGVAYAHTEGGDPLRLDAGVVDWLLRRAPTALGTLRPPPDTYCRVILRVDGAVAGTRAMPADVDFAGKTLVIDGFWRPVGGAWRPFHVAETAAFDLDAPLDGVVLGATTRALAVNVASDPSAWFEGVDLDAKGAGRAVLERVRASLSIGLEAP